VILRYQLTPVVTAISQVVSGNQVSFQIEFDRSVSGFEVSDLEINHGSGTCAANLLSGSGQSYQRVSSDCAEGELSIAVKPNSVQISEVSGPITTFTSATVLIDTVAPSASWSEATSIGSNLQFTEPITALDSSAIDFASSSETCSLSGVSQQDNTIWQVSTTGCEQSNFTLSLLALSVSDASGNLGPQSIITTSFTAEVPEPPVEQQPEEPAQPEVPEPDVEPAPVEEPEEPIASEPEEETPQDISSTPTEEGLREEPVDSPTEIQQPSFADAPAADSDQPVESPVSNPGFQDQITSAPEPDQSSDGPTNGPTYEQTEGSSDELLAPGIFTSPPASSLPQASQTVIIPAQGFVSGFGLNGLTFGLMALGLFAMGAGLVVARRGIPGVLSS
jgi:hypothetical protein